MPQFGTYTDTRDGHVYKTVLMPDGKWWAAENLAWAGAGRDYDDIAKSLSCALQVQQRKGARSSF